MNNTGKNKKRSIEEFMLSLRDMLENCCTTSAVISMAKWPKETEKTKEEHHGLDE